jgi:hypothetical protein
MTLAPFAGSVHDEVGVYDSTSNSVFLRSIRFVVAMEVRSLEIAA